MSSPIQFELKMFSQLGEDGITIEIFKQIGFFNNYYVEFGCEDGMECNTRVLRTMYGCSGLLMDGSNENPDINLQKEFVTAENIVELFEKYAVPKVFDLCSIDIDFNDWYVARKVLEANYRPAIFIVEYNAHHLPTEDKIVIYDASGTWDGTRYFGASLLAFQRLFSKFGYSLLYATSHGVNAYFVQNRFIHKLKHSFPGLGNIEEIYNFPKYGPEGSGHPPDTKCRSFVSAQELLTPTKIL